MQYNKDEFKKCSLCGEPVHPLQETSAEPLADGIACVSCAFGRVDATRKNNGLPSHKVTEKDRDGRWRTMIVPDEVRMPKQKLKECGDKKNV